MRKVVDAAHAYIVSASKGKSVCKHVQNACLRHLADLKRSRGKDYPFVFKPEAAIDAIEFCEMMRHTQGTWATPRLVLEPWQRALVWQLFGWRRKSDGRRRFTTAYIEIARKNGKSLFISCIGLYVWLCEGEPGAQGFTIATKREQAKITWNSIAGQVSAHKNLKEKLDVWKTSITVKNKPEMFFKPLGRDSKTEDGLNPYVLICDEYHAHPTDELLNVMQSGMTARVQPLTLIITTAGHNLYSPCYKERERAVSIASGALDNDGYLSLIYTLDAGDDWTNPDVWIKANPNLGVSVNREALAARVKEALENPSKTNDVKTKNMNCWVEVSSRWIEQKKWDECAQTYRWDDMQGRRCVAAIDLSAVRDITAVAYCFLPTDDDPLFRFCWRYWLPAENIVERERRDKVPYSHWAEQGLISIASSGSVNYDDVFDAITQDAGDVDIAEIAYDPYHATPLVERLKEHFDCVPVRQAPLTMGPLTVEFERALLGREIAHDGNPVSRWMFACMEVKYDRQNNPSPMKPERDKSSARIDGIVAAIMAYGRGKLGEHSGEYDPADYEIRVI